jgi:hypothetical protein
MKTPAHDDQARAGVEYEQLDLCAQEFYPEISPITRQKVSRLKAAIVWLALWGIVPAGAAQWLINAWGLRDE